MNKKLLSLVRVLLSALVVTMMMAGMLATVNAQDTMMTCMWEFEAAVRQGPSTGIALAGALEINIDATGGLTGTLTTMDSQSLNVVGQVDGRAISLALELRPPEAGVNGTYIFGTGVAWNNISPDSECGSIMGGTFAGPQAGDIGDWLGCIRIRGAKIQSKLGSAQCS